MAVNVNGRTGALFLAMTAALSLAGCASAPKHDRLRELVTVQQDAAQAYGAGNMGRALAGYKQLTKQVPQEAEYWFRLGNTYVRLNRPDDAVKAYQEALQRDQGLAKAWHNLGIVRLRQAEAAFIAGAGSTRSSPELTDANTKLADGVAQLTGKESTDEKAPVTSPRSASAEVHPQGSGS